MSADRDATCAHCQADRRLWWLITGPTTAILLAGVAYAVTGIWLVSPFGIGVAWAEIAITAAILCRPRQSGGRP